MLDVAMTSHQESIARSLLRCASCRFAALYFVPFFAGLVLTGGDTILGALLAAAFSLAFSTSVEVTNRLTDRVEDAVNRPERTALCERVGWQRLQAFEVASWCTVAGLGVLWLCLNPSPLLAGLLLAGAVFGVGYSRGPRLARARYAGLVVLNLTFGGVFVLGWAAGTSFRDAPAWHQLASFAPLAVVVGVFVVTLAGIKDITDRHGDLSVGYRSPFVDILDRRRSNWLMALAAAPFALVCLFTLAGLLAPRLLALVAFAPSSVLVVEAALNANTPHERLVVREIFYRYWFIFSSASLLLFTPRPDLLIAIAGAWLYWIMATRWLHWTPSVTFTDIKALWTPMTRRDPQSVHPEATGCQ
ncbi:MAG TPA: UbiA family prenyltransferase [Solirubrobacteraceae bacterium]